MREIKFCKNCEAVLKPKFYGRFKSMNVSFCHRDCYMAWKRRNPNKKMYRGLIEISGYLYVYMPTHPNAIKGGRYIALHRLIAEWKTGRFLTKQEVAHHKDESTLNNTPENIEVLTIAKHNKLTSNSRTRKKDGSYA